MAGWGQTFMSKQRLKIYIDRDRMWGDTFTVRMGAVLNESTGFSVAEPVKFRAMNPDEVSVESLPCFTMSADDAQGFMDELWRVGFRPTEGSGSAGAMAAVQAHLKDMQRLVFTEGERK